MRQRRRQRYDSETQGDPDDFSDEAGRRRRQQQQSRQTAEDRELEHIAHLTAMHFAGTFVPEHCERYATGRVAMVLDRTTQLLAERSARAQQQPAPSHFAQHTAWQHRGAVHGGLGEHGRNTGFHGR